MAIIDCRFRPHTESILRGLTESPIFRDGLLAMGLDLDEYVASAEPVAKICKDLRAFGIEKAILVGRDAETTYGFKPNNDELEKFVEEDPDLFCAFAGLDPHKGMAAVRTLDDLVKNHGFVGAATDPIYNKLPIDHAKFYPIYAKCCELNIPMVITTGPARFTEGTVAQFAHPDQIDRVANDFPELRLIISHGAWPYINEMIGCAFRNKNVYVECSEYEKFPGSDAFIEAAKGILQDRVVFASAHPFVQYKDAVALYDTFGFSDEVKEKIMYTNAAHALGLK